MSVHEYRVFQQNDQNLALANMTMSDCVSLSPKGWGAEPARPTLNPPLNLKNKFVKRIS